jgi:O-6-methylguanine DNA methyltransferase
MVPPKIFFQIEATTPLGTMLGLIYNEHLIYLKFADNATADIELAQFLKKEKAQAIITKEPLKLQLKLQQELDQYFNKSLQQFTIPVLLLGTNFQQQVWQFLQTIPYGKTITYKQQAMQLKNLLGIRAIASANGKNNISIVIPCHRVLGTSGALTGYHGGIDKKKHLLDTESAIKTLSLF